VCAPVYKEHAEVHMTFVLYVQFGNVSLYLSLCKLTCAVPLRGSK